MDMHSRTQAYTGTPVNTQARPSVKSTNSAFEGVIPRMFGSMHRTSSFTLQADGGALHTTPESIFTPHLAVCESCIQPGWLWESVCVRVDGPQRLSQNSRQKERQKLSLCRSESHFRANLNA